jgi:hypothetical protein
LALVGAGCKPTKQATEPPTPMAVPTAVTAPAPEPKMEPLKLVYGLKNIFGPNTTAEVTYWLEEAKTCDGREAYLGLMKTTSPGNGDERYAKITIYKDNGEMAVTRFNNVDSLAFDDAVAEYNSLVIALPVSNIFAAAGKNFNDEANWSATTPNILKAVDNGQEVADYSIIPQAERTDATLAAPCRDFKIIEKGANVNASFQACLSRDIGKTKLPLAVSFGFIGDNANSPSWSLKSFVNEKSGVAWVPQCVKGVKCTAPKVFSDSDRRACNGKGGQVQSVNDESGCNTGYKCLSQEELAEQAIGRTQPPNCTVNPAVKQKLVDCRKQNKQNYDPIRYDDNRCLMDITCRQ